jgi:hypothetical protein
LRRILAIDDGRDDIGCQRGETQKASIPDFRYFFLDKILRRISPEVGSAEMLILESTRFGPSPGAIKQQWGAATCTQSLPLG